MLISGLLLKYDLTCLIIYLFYIWKCVKYVPIKRWQNIVPYIYLILTQIYKVYIVHLLKILQMMTLSLLIFLKPSIIHSSVIRLITTVPSHLNVWASVRQILTMLGVQLLFAAWINGLGTQLINQIWSNFEMVPNRFETMSE